MTTTLQLAYLALGNSYTVGEDVPRAASWPVQLAGSLRAGGISVADLQVLAQTGWTSGELSLALDQARSTPPYHLVSLQIGVNNQYRRLPLDDFRRDFEVLLGRAIRLADGKPGRVLVVSIPDWSVTPFAARTETASRLAAIPAEIDAFNTVKQAAARQIGAQFVDITQISRQAAGQPGMLAGDGLHPSESLYARWVLRILPAARAALAG